MNNLVLKLTKYFGLILIIFFIINILISLFWIAYSKLNKFNNAYHNIQLKMLSLNQVEGNLLFEETWVKRSYVYDQFTEYKEKQIQNGKFVNISDIDGRKINNIPNCKRKFSFYGSSITFGYNVTDSQTFAQKFQDILRTNLINGCVFNFGRAGYGSTQENILFIKHLIENRYNKGDYIFFIEGAAERGLKKGLNTDYLAEAQNLANIPRNKKFINGFYYFWNSLPFIQLSLRLKEKFFIMNNNELIDVKEANLDEIIDVFKHNLEIRNGICIKLSLNCYTFIHPLSGLHGKYFNEFFKSEYPQTEIYDFKDKKNLDMFKKRTEKFNRLIVVNSSIDLSSAFVGANDITYIDRNHFSPYGHKLIADYIYMYLQPLIN